MSGEDDALKALSRSVEAFVEECNRMKREFERDGDIAKIRDISDFIQNIVELEKLCLRVKNEGLSHNIHYHECHNLH